MLRTRLPSYLLPPRAVLLARDVVLFTMPAGACPLSGNQPPFGTVDVSSAAGPLKVAALRSPAAAYGDDDTELLVADPALSEPVAPILLGRDVIELVDELDRGSQRRLLGFLLNFCRKAFDLGADGAFAENCLRLARRCLDAAGALVPVARVTDGWLVVEGAGSATTGATYRISPSGVRRTQLLGLPRHSQMLLEGTEPNDTILSLGVNSAFWTVADPSGACPDLLRDGGHQLREAALSTLLDRSVEFRRRLREVSLLTPAKPIRHDNTHRPIGAGLDDVLADGNGSLFLRGWLRDPQDLVSAMEIVGPTGARTLDASEWHRYRRPDVDQRFAASPFRGGEPRLGFVARVEDSCPHIPHQPTLRLHLHSGAKLLVRAPMRQLDPANARSMVLSAVPSAEVTDAMFAECLAPTAAALHRALLADRSRPECIEIGAALANPTVSVIVPLYRNLSFLRFQIAAFARDPGCAGMELIYVLDSPEQRAEAEHLLRGLHTLHGIPMRLVLMGRNFGYAAANNAGAQFARADKLLLLNSDVVPARAYWLPLLLDALDDDDIGAVGPKLLFDDGSIQHAGLLFQLGQDDQWLNGHYYKGMPSGWPAANRSRHVPGITGAALMLRRIHFEQIGGVCEDYIIGDYEDSDLCLKLRQLGLEIQYVADVELYHFERRSISQHKGYIGTLACRHNRLLHHQRWHDTITPLMARFAGPDLRVAA